MSKMHYLPAGAALWFRYEPDRIRVIDALLRYTYPVPCSVLVSESDLDVIIVRGCLMKLKTYGFVNTSKMKHKKDLLWIVSPQYRKNLSLFVEGNRWCLA